MQKFWELLEKSVVTQGIITIALIGVVTYLVVAGRAIPEGIMEALFLVLGFYFGGKVENRKLDRVMGRLVKAKVKEITEKEAHYGG
jgi:hypothetical protein